MQGQKIVTQPLESDESIFIYNGDIFGGKAIKLDKINEDGDTLLFRNGLDACENVTDFLTSLEGPYAFIYLNKRRKKLYFARDPYGRRSLLLGKSNKIVVLCSVAKRTTDFEFIEVPTTGVFCYDLSTHKITLFSWLQKTSNFNTKLHELENFLETNITVANASTENVQGISHPPSNNDIDDISKLTKTSNGNTIFEKIFCDDEWMKNLLCLNELLETAIEKRISTQPQFCSVCILKKTQCFHALTGVLFSGGVDCAILALIADKYTEKHRPIDLINVAFDETLNFKTPDRLTGLQTLDELKQLRPDRKWNFLKVNVTKDELNEKRIECIADLIYPLTSVLDDSLGCALWFASSGLANGYKTSCRVNSDKNIFD